MTHTRNLPTGEIEVDQSDISAYGRIVMHRRRFGISLLLYLGHLLSPLSASADIYLYRDTKGSLHFSNAPTETYYQYYMPASWKAPSWRWSSSFGRNVRTGRIDGSRRTAYNEIIHEISELHQVDAALIKAVIRTESDFAPHAVSPKGARGMMQLMPGTARMHGVWRVFDARDNINGGVRHLRYLLERYSGNLRLALAAYNAGEGAVAKHGGVPPYPETIDYVSRVIAFRDSYLRQK